MTLASLRLCTDSSEPSLLDNAYCTRLIFRIDTMLQLVHVPNDDDACTPYFSSSVGPARYLAIANKAMAKMITQGHNVFPNKVMHAGIVKVNPVYLLIWIFVHLTMTSIIFSNWHLCKIMCEVKTKGIFHEATCTYNNVIIVYCIY